MITPKQYQRHQAKALAADYRCSYKDALEVVQDDHAELLTWFESAKKHMQDKPTRAWLRYLWRTAPELMQRWSHDEPAAFDRFGKLGLVEPVTKRGAT